MIRAAIGERPFQIFLAALQRVRRSTVRCAGSRERSSFTFVGFAKTGFTFHARVLVPSRLAEGHGRSISTRQLKSQHDMALTRRHAAAWSLLAPGMVAVRRPPHPIVGMMNPLASSAVRGQRLVMALVRV